MEFFQYWEYSWHSRTIRIGTPRTNSKNIKSSGLPKNQRLRSCDHAAKNQVIGYVKLLVGIDKEVVQINSSCLTYMTKRYSKTKNKMFAFNSLIISAAKNLSNKTSCMKEIRLVVTEKKSIFISWWSKSKIAKMEFSHYHTSNFTIQGTQKTVSISISPPKVMFVWFRAYRKN